MYQVPKMNMVVMYYKHIRVYVYEKEESGRRYKELRCIMNIIIMHHEYVLILFKKNTFT